jgi:hypothetical protein
MPDELNASYAAEAYARVNGCGAVLATMNVGSFSALNGVAGAYAERLPVIFVASGYNTNDTSASHLLHHSLGTHDLSYQYEMFKYVTCAAVRIVHPDDAPSMIDHAIRAALRESKPAYIEIACNLSDASCPEPGPYGAIMAPEESSSRALAGAVDRATAVLAGAKKPILLAGAHLRSSYGAIGAFRDVAEALGCAVAVMPDAKGLFPEDHPQYIGIYWGPVSSPGCEAVMDWADVIVAAGPVFSDYTTAGWTGEPPAKKMINLSARDVRFTDAEYTNVAMADFLAGLAKNVHGNDATLTQFHRIAILPGHLRLRDGPRSGPAAGLGHRGRLLPADRPGSGQHDPPRPGDGDLPGQQPRIRVRIGDSRRPVQLLQELGLRRPDRRLERRRWPRAGPDRDNRRGTGRRDQQSTQAQRRPGADRMPDRPRRLQSAAHRMGRKSRPRQHPPAPDHLIRKPLGDR